ncbi:ATP-binding protein [Flavobacterium sp.]|uniref:hybrid sensor histidine kinase/response regulator n=1 Tax=Flavobacterium sp. TaxID=239 RepID=UPI003751B43A
MQPKILTINSNDGLPNDQIHSIACDINERLWLPGPSGISCYNGNNIKVFDSQNSLDCPGLRTVFITKNNIIWIGTDRGIEALNSDGSKINLILNFEWNFGIAECFLITENIIWVGTSYGLIQLENKNYEINLIDSIDLGLVKTIVQKDNNNIVLISAKKGLIDIDINNKVIKPFSSLFLNENNVTTFFKTIDNHYFIGTTNGLFFLNSNLELLEHYVPKTGSPKVTSINCNSNELVVGFNKNLIILDHKFSSLIEQEIIHLKSIINSIYIDKKNNIWIATNNAGLKKISFLRKYISQIDTGYNDAAFSIKESNNKLYIGGAGFFSIYSESETQLIPKLENQTQLKSIVWDSLIDPNNNSKIWLATQDGLYETNSTHPENSTQKFETIISSPNRVLLARENEIWVGTISGLFCIKNNIATEIFNADGTQFGYVYNLTLDTNNQIWIGTLGQGLWYETPKGFVKITNSYLSEKGNTYSIASHQNGNKLVIQEENIVIIDKNLNTKLILKEFPLGGWTAIWINETTIAVGSSNGICIINTNTNKLLHRINLYLSKSEWQFTSTRSLFLDTNKNLFCALNDGLYYINLSKLTSNTKTPNFYLDEINWINTNPVIENNEYQLTVGRWFLEISVYSDWHIDEKQVKYRFKLAGFDQKWSKLNNGFVKFNSLPPGKYELLVQSHTNLTSYSEPVSILIFNVTYTWNTILNSIRKKIETVFNVYKSSNLKNKLLLQQNELLKNEITERQIIQSELTHYKDQLEDLVTNRTKELEKETQRAQKADKMKSLFLANMSHEIRTPLGGIIGLNNILHTTNLDIHQKEYVQKIDNSADHLLQILNNILDISKIESDQIELENIPFSLEKLLFDITEFAQIKIIDKPLKFNVNKKISSKNLLLGDALRLKQIFINLLSNAIKFTENGAISITINQLKSIDELVILHFEVSDSGIGMSEKQMKNLFMAFNQADSSIARKYGGTGLGLNISYKFVELMGGILNCQSEPNNGTTFSFTIAFKSINEKDNLDQQIKENKIISISNSDIDLANENNFNILIAEDNLINQLVIKKMLEGKGFKLTLANDGQKCIDIFKENSNFDLIFMDIRMPNLDGLEATNYIRNTLKNNTIPIIALTADVTLEMQNNITSYGMNDYLSKPIDNVLLQNILEKWLINH